MPKSERLFDMLQFIREYPNLNATDLSRLCGVSERGIYRYLNTLERAGISVRFQNGGYRLQEDYNDIPGKADPEDLKALQVLLSEGMRVCEDEHVVERGRRLLELIGIGSLEGRKERPNEIEIIHAGVAAAYLGGTIAIGHSSSRTSSTPY